MNPRLFIVIESGKNLFFGFQWLLVTKKENLIYYNRSSINYQGTIDEYYTKPLINAVLSTLQDSWKPRHFKMSSKSNKKSKIDKTSRIKEMDDEMTTIEPLFQENHRMVKNAHFKIVYGFKPCCEIYLKVSIERIENLKDKSGTVTAQFSGICFPNTSYWKREIGFKRRPCTVTIRLQ